jgi:RND family efflux transporter MFP subunit
MIKNTLLRVWDFIKRRYIISAVVLVVMILVLRGIFGDSGQDVQQIEVKRGTISQEVEVTGKVSPAQELSLAFEKAGRVISVRNDVGEKVFAGESLVVLEQADLLAQLAQAKASAAAEQANLEDLASGSRPEEIRIKQTAVSQAEQDLQNTYKSVLQTLESGYVNGNDAVRKQTIGMFSNEETINPQLTFSTYDLQAQTDASNLRYVAGYELSVWRKELDALYSSTSHDSLDLALQNSTKHLLKIQTFLNRTSDALVKAINLSETTASAYKTSLTTGMGQVNTAISNISSSQQTISSKELAVQAAQDSLNLAMAGATKEQIDAQRARVDAANANVMNVEAQLDKTVLRAPINGIVTKQDAKVGQIVSPNVQLVGIISEDKYQIDVNIPEVDISKVALGNPVSITLDAIPRETFKGKVISIDPAETVVDGAVNFKVKIAFENNDPRIKSGFTANLTISTLVKENVLFLPQFAILQNDQGIFVKKINDKELIQTAITTGIKGRDGSVEVLSGVSEGDKVANVGLKTAN